MDAAAAAAAAAGADVDIEIVVDDPRREDVHDLVRRHLSFARSVTPPGHVHALDAPSLDDDSITLYSARRGGELLGIGALKQLDPGHGELKSMHVDVDARGQGIGRAIVRHLLEAAVIRGYRRISLETGAGEAFAPARALYETFGFVGCAPFNGYRENPESICMTRALGSY